MAEINSGKFGDGLTVGAINELIIGQILNEVIRHKLKTGEDLLADGELQWISTLLGGILNENQGAVIAGSGTKYNTDNHTLEFSITEDRLNLMLGNISDEDAQVLLQMYDGKMFSFSSANTVKEMLESSYWQIQNAKSNAIVTEEQWQAATQRMSPTELAMSAAAPFVVMGGVIILAEGIPIFIAAGSSAYNAVERAGASGRVLADPNRIIHIMQEKHAWDKIGVNSIDEALQVINRVVSSPSGAVNTIGRNGYGGEVYQKTVEYMGQQVVVNYTYLNGALSYVDVWIRTK